LTSPDCVAEESGALSSSDNRHLGVLALLGDPRPMQALLAVLREVGLQVDVVIDLRDARTTFFGAGGHDCLVVGPDVKPGLALRVANSLSQLSPKLAMATFGPQLNEQSMNRTVRLGSLHPSSRAGQGALIRFLKSL
jgi:hypothetical protein